MVTDTGKSLGKQLVLFGDVVDARTDTCLLMTQVQSHFGQNPVKAVRDLQKFALQKDDFWVLDRDLHLFMSDVFRGSSIEPQTPPDLSDMRAKMLRIFSVCALRDTFVHFLNLDRQQRILMNYASSDFDSLSLNEQKGLALLFCNLFSNSHTRHWLLYLSQWQSQAGAITSNAQITCSVAQSCMKSLNPKIQDYGSGICYNISICNFGASQSIDVILEPFEQMSTSTGSPDYDHASVTNGMVTLKAKNAIALEICASLYDLLLKRRLRSFQNDLLHRYLSTLANMLPNVKEQFLNMNPKAGQDLSHVAETYKDCLSENNQSQLNLIFESLQYFNQTATNGQT